MKKAMLISASLALLLLSGCGDKEEIKSDVQDKSSEITQEVVDEVKSVQNSGSTIQSDVKNKATEITESVVEELNEVSEDNVTIKSDVEDKAVKTNEELTEDIEKKSDEIKEDVEELSQNSESGEMIYNTNCKHCHGADGKLPALQKSKPIAGWDSAKVLDALIAYKTENLNSYGLGGTMRGILMPLDEDQMQKVSDYVSTLK